MGYESDLLVGIAELLATASVGTWSETGTYAANVTAITLRKMPAAPDAAIALSTYGVADDPTLSDGVTGLQVRSRAAGPDPRTHDDLADAVFEQLQGLHDVTLTSGVYVVFVERRSFLDLGQDALQRWERSDNYYVTTHRPSLNRQ